jgi:uncharacterized linocin/CFP29 family protein
MHHDLLELGWTEEHWNRICATVTEEAQRARIAAQMLPMVGPEEGSTIAVPRYALEARSNPDGYPVERRGAEATDDAPTRRLAVNSTPNLFLSTIAVNVALRSHEVADGRLNAALGMFRRAANCIARAEDALVFNGLPRRGAPRGVGDLPAIFTLTSDAPGDIEGLVPFNFDVGGRVNQRVLRRLRRGLAHDEEAERPPLNGNDVINAIIDAIGELDARGQQGPYACGLSQDLFALICTPNDSLVLPRDRILPFLQGPLLRASALGLRHGLVVALGGTPVEIVVGADLAVKYLQATLEPRYVFRVSERIALRIREQNAIAVIT